MRDGVSQLWSWYKHRIEGTGSLSRWAAQVSEPSNPAGVHLTALLSSPSRSCQSRAAEWELERKGRGWWLLNVEFYSPRQRGKERDWPSAISLSKIRFPWHPLTFFAKIFPLRVPYCFFPSLPQLPVQIFLGLRGVPPGNQRRGTPKHLDPLRFLWLRNPGVPPSSSLSLTTQEVSRTFWNWSHWIWTSDLLNTFVAIKELIHL